MLKEFSGMYVGFTRSNRIGEIFEHGEDKWVVIRMLNPKFKMHKEPKMQVDIIAQKIGKVFDYSPYYEQQTVTDRIKLEGKKPWEFHLKKTGDVIALRDNKRGTKVLFMILGVESFEYEFVDLIIKYRTQLIKPWSEQEINKVVQENRLSTFKVITGNKNTAANEE